MSGLQVTPSVSKALSLASEVCVGSFPTEFLEAMTVLANGKVWVNKGCQRNHSLLPLPPLLPLSPSPSSAPLPLPLPLPLPPPLPLSPPLPLPPPSLCPPPSSTPSPPSVPSLCPLPFLPPASGWFPWPVPLVQQVSAAPALPHTHRAFLSPSMMTWTPWSIAWVTVDPSPLAPPQLQVSSRSGASYCCCQTPPPPHRPPPHPTPLFCLNTLPGVGSLDEGAAQCGTSVRVLCQLEAMECLCCWCKHTLEAAATPADKKRAAHFDSQLLNLIREEVCLVVVWMQLAYSLCVCVCVCVCVCTVW